MTTDDKYIGPDGWQVSTRTGANGDCVSVKSVTRTEAKEFSK